MDDAELVGQLRLPWFTNGCEWLQRKAADRIEALIAERDRYLRHLTAGAESIKKAEAERDEARAAWKIDAATVKRFAERHERHLVLGAEVRARAEKAEAALHGPITPLTQSDMSNIIAHLSPDLEPSGPLPNRNSLMMALIEAQNAHKAALTTARRDAYEEAARRIEETMNEAIRENGPAKSATDKAVVEMLEAIAAAIRALKGKSHE